MPKYIRQNETALTYFSIFLTNIGLHKIQGTASLIKKAKSSIGKKKRGRPVIHKTYNKLHLLRFFAIGAVFSFVFLYIPFFIYTTYRSLPSPTLVKNVTFKCTSILDKHGILLYEICPEKKGDPIELNQVSPYVTKATIAIEDSSFYSHNGFKLSSIARAFYETIFKKNVQGGSTITQQLVKLTLLSPEQTLERKVKELLLSIAVERLYTKDQILGMYLNLTPYTGNLVGIEAASEKIFGVKASGLDLAQSALLAGLPSAPSIYSPYYSLSGAKERQKLVLDRMVTEKMITKDEADQAYAENLVILPEKDYIRAPHFVEYVRGILEDTYGKRYLTYGGLTVTTTLDVNLNDKAQAIIRDEIAKDAYLNVSNAASVVMDVKKGDILAMVGSVDYFSDKIDGKFNSALAFRQPGSSIKAVTYSLALENGYTAASILNDNPTVIKTDTEVYTPVNYDGKFHGNVPLRAALANSYNVAAVNLVRALGPDNMVSLGHRMGLSTWQPDHSYGVSVTLGGKETRLLDLTNVYATLARYGTYTSTNAISSVKDVNGYEIYNEDQSTDKVLPDSVAYVMANILSDAVARIPEFGVNNSLTIPGHQIAVKTGTTDYKRDNYTVGYTPSYVVGVWVGNNNNTPMNQVLASGLTGAAPIWNQIMSEVLKGSENEAFVMPPDTLVAKLCDGRNEVFVKGTEPKGVCSVPKEKEKDQKSHEVATVN